MPSISFSQSVGSLGIQAMVYFGNVFAFLYSEVNAEFYSES